MIKFNEVTWYSKLAAIIFFIAIVPILAFYIGARYQEVKDINKVMIQMQNNTLVDNKNEVDSKEIMEVGKLVLTALKNKDYFTLNNLTSSEGLTVSLTPYKIFDPETAWTYGDKDEFQATTSAKKNFSKEEVLNIGKSSMQYVYGNTDGKGDTIIGTTQYFFDKWVYNHDYLNAPEITLNNVREGGNSVKTIKNDVGSRDFILYYFPGFKEEFKGFDWTSMYLVFEKENGEYKLRAIVKDNWTI